MVLGQPCGHSVRFPKEKAWFGHPEGGGRVEVTSCMFRKMQRFVLFKRGKGTISNLLWVTLR